MLGIIIAPHLIIYRHSCDTTKFSWTWSSQSELDKKPIECYNSNQRLERETSTYMILQVIKSELRYPND